MRISKHLSFTAETSSKLESLTELFQTDSSKLITALIDNLYRQKELFQKLPLKEDLKKLNIVKGLTNG